MATQTQKNFVRAAVLACGALLAVLPAVAQSSDAPPPPPPSAMGPGDHAGHAAGKEMKELRDELNLTPDQAKTVKAAFEEEMIKMKAVKDDTTLAPRDKRKTMMAAHQDADAKIKAVLTDDQKPKYEAWEAKRREEMKSRRGGGGGGGGGGAMGAPPAGGSATPPPPPGV